MPSGVVPIRSLATMFPCAAEPRMNTPLEWLPEMTSPPPAVPRPDRLADLVIARQDKHAIAAVVEDEVALDEVSGPVRTVQDDPRFTVALDHVASIG